MLSFFFIVVALGLYSVVPGVGWGCGFYGMLGIESRLVKCKAVALPLNSLQPKILIFLLRRLMESVIGF